MVVRCAIPIPGSAQRGRRERPLGRSRRSFVAKSIRGVACASSPGFGNAREPKVDCKPGSVPTPGFPRAGEDHSSRRCIAAPFERSDPDTGSCALRRNDIERVALNSIPIRACSGRGLPRRRSPGCRAWALTPRFQPCLCLPAHPSVRRSTAIGGLVSVALSLGLPRVAVNDLPTLWSPDFPPADGGCPPAILHPPPAPERLLGRALPGQAPGKAPGKVEFSRRTRQAGLRVIRCAL